MYIQLGRGAANTGQKIDGERWLRGWKDCHGTEPPDSSSGPLSVDGCSHRRPSTLKISVGPYRTESSVPLDLVCCLRCDTSLAEWSPPVGLQVGAAMNGLMALGHWAWGCAPCNLRYRQAPCRQSTYCPHTPSCSKLHPFWLGQEPTGLLGSTTLEHSSAADRSLGQLAGIAYWRLQASGQFFEVGI